MTTEQKPTIIKQLENARAYLIRCGWRQKSTGFRDQPACLLGAVYWANPSMGFEAIEYVKSFLRQKTTNHYMTIHRWNDHPERTVEEVYALIEEVIEAVEKEPEECATK